LESLNFNIDNLKNEIARSNELAFRKLFDYFYPRLLNYAFVIIKNHESAEDIVLEVLHSIWENREKLKTIERIESYLYVCTKNKTLDQLRANSRLLNARINQPNYKEYITHQNPETEFINLELLEIVDKAILDLPEKTRLVYRLVKEDRLKYQEVADILGVSVKTINNQLVFAVKSVRECVLNYMSEQKQIPVLRSLKSLLFLNL